jgi:hypothetical protein
MVRDAAPDHLRLRLPARHAGHLRDRLASALRLLAVAVLALALAGCGQLPRPFKPEAKGGNELLLLPDRTGVAVGVVTGDLPDGRAMAEAMAEALRRQNVPAAVGVGNRQAHWLLGAVERTARSGGQATRRFVWELYGPDGRPVRQITRSVSLPQADWNAPSGLARAAAAAAPALAAALQGPAPETVSLPGYPAGTRIAVAEVTGRPLDLARALRGAMAEQLRRRGLPLGDRAGEGDIVLTGRVATQETANAQSRRLSVTWTVGRRGESQPLGDLNQANQVPAAQLNAPDRLAETIAGAALPGVLQVLREAGPEAARARAGGS